MTEPAETPTPEEALRRLRDGNRRFMANVISVQSLLSQVRRADLVGAQRPFAIVLGCSDSRAPAETLFDQGLGELFVIRVAGNVVAPSQVGSVEFAAERFGCRLVVVLGHTHCGAVDAAYEAIASESGQTSKNLESIVHRVRPAVEAAILALPRHDRAAVLRDAVRRNVQRSVDQLRHGSSILESMVRDRGLSIVGAEYDIASGEVIFL